MKEASSGPQESAPAGRGSAEAFTFADVVSRRWRRWGLYFLFWTVLGVLNAASAITDMSRLGVPAWKPIVYEMSSLYTSGLLVPLVALFLSRFPFSMRRWRRRLAQHLAAMVAFSLLHTSGMVLMRKAVFRLVGETYVFSGGGFFIGGYGEYASDLLYEFYKDIGLYWAIIFLVLGWQSYSRYRSQQLEASRLETRLVEARLANLKGQLHPHFLFNTLNLISSLMYENIEAADRMISRLSDLLRLSLSNADRQEVLLAEELELLEIYLEIMKARFHETLRVRREIDPRSVGSFVPSLLLQPLVENAIRHGIAKRSQGGTIRISSRVEACNGDRDLVLEVEDDGVGCRVPSDDLLRSGHGLSNTAERLRRLYGSRHQLKLHSPASCGFAVQMRIPYRQSAQETAG